jgi:hypothetical protein
MGRPRKWPGDTRKERDAALHRAKRAAMCPATLADMEERNTLKTRYGLTPEDVDAFIVEQKARCAVCEEVLIRKRGSFAIDHNHTTKKVRGLLCHRCNVYVGFYEKSEPFRGRIREYLRERN